VFFVRVEFCKDGFGNTTWLTPRRYFELCASRGFARAL